MNLSSTWWATNIYEPWWLISRRDPRVTEQVRMSIKRTQNALLSVTLLSKVARQRQVHIYRWLETLTSSTIIRLHKQPSVLEETGVIIGLRIQAGSAVYEYEMAAILIPVRLWLDMQGLRHLWCLANSTNEWMIHRITLCQIRSVIG